MLGYWTVPSFQAQNQVSKKKKQLCELEPRCFLFMCPKTEKNCTGSAKSCINVRCWINCYYQTPPKEFDWPATSPETDRNKKTLGTSCEQLSYVPCSVLGFLTRKRFAFLHIRWFIHKCLTIEVERRQWRREARLPLAFGKGVPFFYSEQKQKSCLCLVQEVLHTLMSFQ